MDISKDTLMLRHYTVQLHCLEVLARKMSWFTMKMDCWLLGQKLPYQVELNCSVRQSWRNFFFYWIEVYWTVFNIVFFLVGHNITQGAWSVPIHHRATLILVEHAFVTSPAAFPMIGLLVNTSKFVI